MTRSDDRLKHVVLLLTLGAASLTLGLARHSDVTGIYDRAFWSAKLQWHAEADVLLLGDSRTYISVNPESLGRALGRERVRNFGFSDNGLGEAYLERSESALRQEDPIVVVGVTSHAFVPSALENNQFLRSLADDSEVERVKMTHLPELYRFFARVPLGDVSRYWQTPATTYARDYQPSGWMRARRTPENPDLYPQIYEQIFEREQVSDAAVSAFMAKVAEWSRRGWRVFGFRPPTTRAMDNVEDRLSGLDFEAFQQEFQQAGGHWLTLERDGYRSYDGSHLDAEQATLLGAELGRQIRSHDDPH